MFLLPGQIDSEMWFYNKQNIKFVDPEFPGCFNTKLYSVLANTSTLGKYASDYPMSDYYIYHWAKHTDLFSSIGLGVTSKYPPKLSYL